MYLSSCSTYLFRFLYKLYSVESEAHEKTDIFRSESLRRERPPSRSCRKGNFLFRFASRSNLLIFMPSQSSFCLRGRAFPSSRILTRDNAHPCGIRIVSFGRAPCVVTRLRLFYRAVFYREFAKCITRPLSNALCRRSHRDDGFSSALLCHAVPSSIALITRYIIQKKDAYALQINSVPRINVTLYRSTFM